MVVELTPEELAWLEERRRVEALWKAIDIDTPPKEDK